MCWLCHYRTRQFAFEAEAEEARDTEAVDVVPAGGAAEEAETRWAGDGRRGDAGAGRDGAAE